MSEAQIAGGHKANLKNPNTSEESKQHSKEVLENEFDDGNGMMPHNNPFIDSVMRNLD